MRGTPLEPFVKKRLLCKLNKSLLSGFLPYYAFILASHWLVVTEKEYLNRAATFRKQ